MKVRAFHAVGVVPTDAEPEVMEDDVEVDRLPSQHDGIWTVELRSYGDDPGASYLGVIGFDREKVVARWKAVADGWPRQVFGGYADPNDAAGLQELIWGPT